MTIRRLAARFAPALFAAAAALGHTTPARAELIVTESFDYTGFGVAGQNGGSGWNNSTWQPLTAGSNLSLSDDDQSLDYPGPVTFTPAGERISSGAGGVGRQFGTGNSLSLHNDSGKNYYISILVRKDDAGSFTIRGNNSSNQPRFIFGIDSQERYFTDLFNNLRTSDAGAAPVGETILIVARFLNGGPSGANDHVELVAFTDGDAIPAAEPTDWLVSSPGNTNIFQQQLEIIVDAGNVEIDEIRVGTEWADVVAVPEPASAALALMGVGLVIGRTRRGREI